MIWGKLEFLYFQYVNDFLTVQAFAEFHRVSTERAERIIRLGRVSHARRIRARGGENV